MLCKICHHDASEHALEANIIFYAHRAPCMAYGCKCDRFHHEVIQMNRTK